MTGPRIFSFGGGVQSTAALVLAARGELDFPTFAYANVGDDHEPETLDYVREVAVPFAASHEIELVEVTRGGMNPTILAKLDRSHRTIGIPMRMDRTGAPGRRGCTFDYKITPLVRLARERGATREAPAIVGLGITVDEIQRVRSAVDPKTPIQRREYPLVELGLTRQDCLNVISSSGLPTPPKSACYFCPFHSLSQWRELRLKSRPQFDAAADLERRMQERRAALGLDPVWLTDLGARHRIRLDELVDHDQLTLDENVDNCDEGLCFT